MELKADLFATKARKHENEWNADETDIADNRRFQINPIRMADLIAPDFPCSGAFDESGESRNIETNLRPDIFCVYLVFRGWVILVLMDLKTELFEMEAELLASMTQQSYFTRACFPVEWKKTKTSLLSNNNPPWN